MKVHEIIKEAPYDRPGSADFQNIPSGPRTAPEITGKPVGRQPAPYKKPPKRISMNYALSQVQKMMPKLIHHTDKLTYEFGEHAIEYFLKKSKEYKGNINKAAESVKENLHQEWHDSHFDFLDWARDELGESQPDDYDDPDYDEKWKEWDDEVIQQASSYAYEYNKTVEKSIDNAISFIKKIRMQSN
jgi:hypothetical protein